MTRLPNNWSADLGDGVIRRINHVRRKDKSDENNGDDVNSNRDASNRFGENTDDGFTGSGYDSE